MNLSDLRSMEIRLKMHELGWDSEDNLSKKGWINGYVYSIWFRRYDWHKRSTIALTGRDVCFHKHTNNLNEIDLVTRLCAEQAIKAYEEYPNSIPCLDANGETVEDLMLRDWNDVKAIIK